MTTAVLREHRKRCKRSHVIEFKKKSLGHQWSPKSTSNRRNNCKENKAWRCFLACFRLKLASRSPHAYTSFMCSCSAFFWEMEETKCSSAFEESCFWRLGIAGLGWRLGNVVLCFLFLHFLNATIAKAYLVRLRVEQAAGHERVRQFAQFQPFKSLKRLIQPPRKAIQDSSGVC